jgi:hypothetical protein
VIARDVRPKEASALMEYFAGLRGPIQFGAINTMDTMVSARAREIAQLLTLGLRRAACWRRS